MLHRSNYKVLKYSLLLFSGIYVKFISLCFFFEDKEYGPKTVKDVKLICAGKILENNKTVEECQSPLCNLPGGVTTMLVVVQPPNLDKGLYLFLKHVLKAIIGH